MKILFVITGLGLGGAEKQVCLLADKLSLSGHHVKIISLGHMSNNKVFPSENNVNVINVNMSKNISGVIKGCVRIRDVIANFKPDIVHSHMFHANIITRLSVIGIKNRPGIISTAHNKNEGGYFRMLTYRITDCLSDCCTNVSKEAVDEFLRIKAFNPAKAITMYNGIDTNKFKFDLLARREIRDGINIKNDDILLLAAGRLTL
ncbi:TPA: glycosyltransferase, partial [Escherichia coli]